MYIPSRFLIFFFVFFFFHLFIALHFFLLSFCSANVPFFFFFAQHSRVKTAKNNVDKKNKNKQKKITVVFIFLHEKKSYSLFKKKLNRFYGFLNLG